MNGHGKLVERMAKWIIGSGLDDYLAQLQELEENTDDIMKKAIYQGAAVVASEIRSASIPVRTRF